MLPELLRLSDTVWPKKPRPTIAPMATRTRMSPYSTRAWPLRSFSLRRARSRMRLREALTLSPAFRHDLSPHYDTSARIPVLLFGFLRSRMPGFGPGMGQRRFSWPVTSHPTLQSAELPVGRPYPGSQTAPRRPPSLGRGRESVLVPAGKSSGGGPRHQRALASRPTHEPGHGTSAALPARRGGIAPS